MQKELDNFNIKENHENPSFGLITTFMYQFHFFLYFLVDNDVMYHIYLIH